MQTFKLEINAECKDGEEVQCMIAAKIACERDMAVGVMVNLMKQDKKLKDIIMEALVFSIGEQLDEETKPSSDEDVDL